MPKQLPREVECFVYSPIIYYDVTAALSGKSCSPWIFQRISVTVWPEFLFELKTHINYKKNIVHF